MSHAPASQNSPDMPPGAVARALRDPFAALRTVLLLATSRFKTRHCARVGALPRVWGRLLIEGTGTITLGDKVRIRATHVPVELVALPGAVLTLGDGVFINSGTSICAAKSVIIGNNVAIGNYSLIMDTYFHTPGDHTIPPEPQPVWIEDDAWIGARVTILKGVHIGRGATVAAGAVVTRNVAAGVVVGGVPAKPLAPKLLYVQIVHAFSAEFRIFERFTQFAGNALCPHVLHNAYNQEADGTPRFNALTRRPDAPCAVHSLDFGGVPCTPNPAF